MVRGQILSQKEMYSYRAEERNEALSKIDITEEELQRIWSLPVEERVVPAAELLYEKTECSENITSTNVSAIIIDDWKGKKSELVGGRVISKFFKTEMDGINTELVKRHHISYTQLLRDSVVGPDYTDQVLKVSKNWDNFKFSSSDWLRRIKIPEEITPETAQLLGIDWGDGVAHYDPHYNQNSFYIDINGNRDDFPFYYEVVKPLVKRVHNLEVPVYTKRKITELDGKSYRCIEPGVEICSKGITTWLVDDLGFPITQNKTNVILPKIDLSYENKQEFFYAIVASMGSLRLDEDSMRLTDKDETFIRNLKGLSESIGYTPTLKTITHSLCGSSITSYQLGYSPREVKRMKLINPKHQRK